MRRRKTAIFFLVLGICLIGLAVALNIGWILLNLRDAHYIDSDGLTEIVEAFKSTDRCRRHSEAV